MGIVINVGVGLCLIAISVCGPYRPRRVIPRRTPAPETKPRPTPSPAAPPPKSKTEAAVPAPSAESVESIEPIQSIKLIAELECAAKPGLPRGFQRARKNSIRREG